MARWWFQSKHFWSAAHNAGVDPDWTGTNETWNGGGGDDTHTGTNQADTLDGMGGNDTINGGKGGDTITGGAGNDTLNGDDGNDIIHAGNGVDPLASGGAGDDTIVIDAIGGTVNLIDGGTGFDTVDATAVANVWQINSLSGVERLILSEFSETFTGVDTDEIWEGRGGDDNLAGAGGNDTMLGGEGADTLFGGIGNDTIDGENGNDILIGNADDDTFDGGAGFDHIYFFNSLVGVTANLKTGVATGEGNDTIDNVEALIGSTHDDHLTGDNGANNLAGIEGDDTIDGGKGIDWLYYNSTNAAVTVNLQTGTSSGALGHDTISNMENLVGGGGNDTLTGSKTGNQIFGFNGADTIKGGQGDDFLFGEAGDNTLTGGEGVDVMTGGTGADHFTFAAIAAGVVGNHYINDLENADTIDLSAIDAKTGSGNQAFTLVSALNGHKGQAAFFFNGTQTLLQLDTDGDGAANFTIVIAGDHDDFANFVL